MKPLATIIKKIPIINPIKERKIPPIAIFLFDLIAIIPIINPEKHKEERNEKYKSARVSVPIRIILKVYGRKIQIHSPAIPIKAKTIEII